MKSFVVLSVMFLAFFFVEGIKPMHTMKKTDINEYSESTIDRKGTISNILKQDLLNGKKFQGSISTRDAPTPDANTNYEDGDEPVKDGKITDEKKVRMAVRSKASTRIDIGTSAKYLVGGYSTVTGGYNWRYKGWVVRARIVRYRGYCSFGRTLFVVGRYIIVRRACIRARLYVVINI